MDAVVFKIFEAWMPIKNFFPYGERPTGVSRPPPLSRFITNFATGATAGSAGSKMFLIKYRGGSPAARGGYNIRRP